MAKSNGLLILGLAAGGLLLASQLSKAKAAAPVKPLPDSEQDQEPEVQENEMTAQSSAFESAQSYQAPSPNISPVFNFSPANESPVNIPQAQQVQQPLQPAEQIKTEPVLTTDEKALPAAFKKKIQKRMLQKGNQLKRAKKPFDKVKSDDSLTLSPASTEKSNDSLTLPPAPEPLPEIVPVNKPVEVTAEPPKVTPLLEKVMEEVKKPEPPKNEPSALVKAAVIAPTNLALKAADLGTKVATKAITVPTDIAIKTVTKPTQIVENTVKKVLDSKPLQNIQKTTAGKILVKPAVAVTKVATKLAVAPVKLAAKATAAVTKTAVKAVTAPVKAVAKGIKKLFKIKGIGYVEMTQAEYEMYRRTGRLSGYRTSNNKDNCLF